MNKQRIALLIAAGVGMLGTFLPWVEVWGVIANGTDGDGWITLIIFLAVGILGFIGKKNQAITSKLKYVCAAAGGFATIMGFIVISRVNSIGIASVGIGVYVIIIAGIGVCVISLAAKLFNKSNQQPQAVPQNPNPEQKNIFCSKCGSKNDFDAKFCNDCGEAV